MKNISRLSAALVPDEMRPLVFDFFTFFSRFEFALKNSGYLQKKDRAEPHWDAFAKKNTEEFSKLQNQELSVAKTYLIDNPPLRQMVGARGMEWKEIHFADDQKSLVTYIRIVKQVRNNLFHGGKFPLRPVIDPARDRDLLQHSLVILQHCVQLEEKVQREFSQSNVA